MTHFFLSFSLRFENKELMYVLNELEKDSDILLKSLKKDFLKAIVEKYHLLLGTDKDNAFSE